MSGEGLFRDGHECLNQRFPGATEFQWRLTTAEGPKRFRVSGRFECDDGDVLTDWALAGNGIVMKPIFEVAEHMKAGRLVQVVTETPPEPVQMACLFTPVFRRRFRLSSNYSRLSTSIVISENSDAHSARMMSI